MQMDLGEETRYQVLNAEPEWDCAVSYLDPVQIGHVKPRPYQER